MPTFMRPISLAICLAVSFLVTACAVMVASAPTTFTPINSTTDIQLRSNVEFRLSTAYKRTLSEGSRWRLVGKVPQGDVYRPLDAPFSIEGRQVHEAYLVISAGSLVGFYLPAEGGYSPLPGAIPIPIGDSR